MRNTTRIVSSGSAFTRNIPTCSATVKPFIRSVARRGPFKTQSKRNAQDFAGDPPERADGWQLVLQIDSDTEVGMEWGDVGRLYVCARKEDVAAGRFDRCWTVMQCY